jgi:hypothetical protein
MPPAYGEIERVLRWARRREARILLLAASGLGLAAALVVALAGAWALSRGLGHPGAVRQVALSLAAFCLVGTATWAGLALLRRASSPEATARSVGRGAPALRSDLVSAVELSRDYGGLAAQGYSLALVDAHVERTASRAAEVDLDLAIPATPARRAGVALAGAAALCLLALAFGGKSLGRGFARLAGLGPPPPVAAPDPITGDVELTFLYPAHTGRPSRTVSGTGGEVAAPRGTEVRLSTRADRPVEAADIVLQGTGVPAVRPSTPGPAAGGKGFAPGPYAQDERISGSPVRPSTPGPAAGGRGFAAGPYAQDERISGSSVRPSTPGPGAASGGFAPGPYAQDERTSQSPVRPERRPDSPAAAPAPRAAVEGRTGGDVRAERVYSLEVKDSRQLTGRFLVDEPGTYRFRFRTGRKVVAEGPPIAIAVEPDAFPEVRLTAPAPDVEVDAGARLRVDWSASDDYGLKELALVVKPPAGPEERRPLRTFEATRRESGSFDLDLAAWKASEGERLLYWLEVLDNDAVSGPKRGASATQVVRIYSEAEHRRRMMERAQALWERLVRLLGDRLELPEGQPRLPERLARAQVLDGRARELHESLRDAAAAMRKERAAPRAVIDALRNAASGIRAAEQPLSAARSTALRLAATLQPGDGVWRRIAELDASMDRELERDALYLESLFDKERAQDLVRLARDLQSRRRDLASLLEKYRKAPSEEARHQLVAEISRMKARMQDMLRRMAELAKGINDEHMNAEALAEMARQRDALGGLDRVEELLAKGDVEGAMKELDALGSRMQEMLSSLERTAGEPDERTRELMKEMRAFRDELGRVEKEQGKLAAETDRVRQEYRKKLEEQLRRMSERAGHLEKLARESRQELQRAKDGLSSRGEEDYAKSREALQDLEKSLHARDFDAALESVRKALPSMQRLALGLEDDAQLTERFPQPPGQKGPLELREAGRHALQAMAPAKKVREELERLFPDPRRVLSQRDQQKLDGQSQRQRDLERQAGALRQRLQELAEKAPVFPPQSQAMLGEAQGHMGRAAGELGQRNPQRGHGQQREALDALGRLRKGLEEMAKNARGQGGQGFPFPFAMGGEEGREGEEGELSHERVEIPGAEAYKVPEEFRRDILEAMKQGAPEPYKPELQRYYEELVK